MSEVVVMVEEREVRRQRRTRGAFMDKQDLSRDRDAFVELFVVCRVVCFARSVPRMKLMVEEADHLSLRYQLSIPKKHWHS